MSYGGTVALHGVSCTGQEDVIFAIPGRRRRRQGRHGRVQPGPGTPGSGTVNVRGGWT